MALVLGTNSGFVSVAPTADPSDGVAVMDGNARVTKHTSPAGAGKITEVGWWCDNNTEASNFEVGLYSADGSVVPGEAGTLLFSSTTNAKGTTSGWKTATVDWTISGSTVYWIAVQLDDTATTTNTNFSGGGGNGYDTVTATTLPNPFGGGTIFSSAGMLSIYAVWQAASGPTNLKSYNTNVKSNIKSINTNPIANVKSLNTNA